MKSYEIEKIVDRKKKNHKIFYLIKWKGYSSSENTWEPQEHLTNASQILKEFEKEQQKKVSRTSLRSSIKEKSPIVQSKNSKKIRKTARMSVRQEQKSNSHNKSQTQSNSDQVSKSPSVEVEEQKDQQQQKNKKISPKSVQNKKIKPKQTLQLRPSQQIKATHQINEQQDKKDVECDDNKQEQDAPTKIVDVPESIIKTVKDEKLVQYKITWQLNEHGIRKNPCYITSKSLRSYDKDLMIDYLESILPNSQR